MISGRKLAILTILVLFILSNDLSPLVGQDERFEDVAEKFGLKQNYREITQSLNLSRVERDIATIAGFRGRFTGYEGAWKTAQFIYENFRATTDHAEYQNYSIVVPVDKGANITITSSDGKPDGAVIKAFPLFPNLAQQCIVPEDGMRGKLVYVEKGQMGNVSGSIVLMDFNTGSYWVEAVKMGAKAVIFIQPPFSSSDESLSKIVYTELYFPRLLVSYEDGLRLKQLAMEHDVEVSISSRIVYEEVTASNVLGFIWGSQYKNETIIVSAYYDDWCVAPSLAGGYDSAVSIALLLELARVFSVFRPKRNVLFLATSGHWQAAYGIKSFAMKMLLQDNPRNLPFELGSLWNETAFFFISMDLSTYGDSLAVVTTGGLVHMTSQTANPQSADQITLCGLDHLFLGHERYRGFPDIYRAIKESLGMEVNVRVHSVENSATSLANSTGRYYEYFTAIPEKYFVEAEVWLSIGLPGITFYTPVLRRAWFSPTPLNDVDMNNLRPQAFFIASFIHFTANGERKGFVGSKCPDITRGDFVGPTRYYMGRYGSSGGLARLRFQIYQYNASEILQYSPILSAPLAYIVDKEEEGNIFYYTFSIGFGNGTFEMMGFPVYPSSALWPRNRQYSVRTFVLNGSSGEITYAPDFGIFGGRRFSDTIMLQAINGPDVGYPTPLRIILFKAGSVTLFDVFHPRVHRVEKWTDNYNLDFNVKIRGLGSTPYIYPSEPGIRVYYLGSRVETMNYGTTADFDKGIYTVFIPIETPVEVHVILTSEQGYVETVAVLTNATESKPKGYGISVSRPGEDIMIMETLHRMAKDVYYLAKSRVDLALSKSIYDEAAMRSLEDLEQSLLEIDAAKRRGDYSKAYSLQFLAYAHASNALTSSENLLTGVRSTSIVFFLLLIPFILFFERLITAFHEGKKRLLTIIILFAVFSIPLIYFHPGFILIENLPVLLLGFLTESVALLVLFLFWMEGGSVIKEYKVRLRGAHFFEKTRVEMAIMMFAYGVEQMKRRKLLFSLTLFSLTVIVATSVLLFSSSSLPLPSVQERQWSPDYPWPGNYLHIADVRERGLSSKTITMLKSIVGSEGKFGFMTYVYPPIPNVNERKNYFSIVTEDKRAYEVPLIVGLSPEVFTLPSYNSSITKGDVKNFQSTGSPYVVRCLISQSFSDEAHLSVGSRFKLLGTDFLVTAVFDDIVMNSIRDYPSPSTSQLPEDLNKRLETGTSETKKEFLAWDKVVIIPFEDCEKLFNAKPLKAFIMGNVSTLDEIGYFLAANSFNTHVILGLDGKTRWYRTVVFFMAGGSTFIFIPLILGALIMVNMILGFLTTRKKEADIFSTLGASPTHIVAMLLSEISTYALLATVLGYIAGILIIKVFVPPFYPNFSSGYLLTVFGIQLLSMFIASIPFLIKVSKAVTPSLQRRWRIPTKPKGDSWIVPTPFTSSPEEAPAILSFMKEWLDTYMVRETTARFVSLEPAKLVKEEEAMKLLCPIILPPWEAGVNQDFELVSIVERGRASFSIKCHLKSGLKDAWLRSNPVFIYAVREQLLLWRGLSLNERKKYISLASAMEGGEPV